MKSAKAQARKKARRKAVKSQELGKQRMNNRKRVKEEYKAMNDIEEKAFTSETPSKDFFTWEKFEEMYKETAKVIYVNGKSIEVMLKDEKIKESLVKSPGAAQLVDRYALTINALTKMLNSIHEKHKGKVGVVNVGDSDMELIFDIYESYESLRAKLEDEFIPCFETLKELQDGPIIYVSPEDQAAIEAAREEHCVVPETDDVEELKLVEVKSND